jgi:hypothetical protein
LFVTVKTADSGELGLEGVLRAGSVHPSAGQRWLAPAHAAPIREDRRGEFDRWFPTFPPW